MDESLTVTEDGRRQSILKQIHRIPLQDVHSLFPDDDATVTNTMTRSRRVSFGRNLVKGFIVGSAASTQAVFEYEQSSESISDPSECSGPLDLALNKTVPTGHNASVPQEASDCTSQVSAAATHAPDERARLFTANCINIAKSVFQDTETELTAIIIGAKPSSMETSSMSFTNLDISHRFDHLSEMRGSQEFVPLTQSEVFTSTAHDPPCPVDKGNFNFLDRSISQTAQKLGPVRISRPSIRTPLSQLPHYSPWDNENEENIPPAHGLYRQSAPSTPSDNTMEFTCANVKGRQVFDYSADNIYGRKGSASDMEETCARPLPKNAINGDFSFESSDSLDDDPLRLDGTHDSDFSLLDGNDIDNQSETDGSPINHIQKELANLSSVNQSFRQQLNSLNVSTLASRNPHLQVEVSHMTPSDDEDEDNMEITGKHDFSLANTSNVLGSADPAPFAVDIPLEDSLFSSAEDSPPPALQAIRNARPSLHARTLDLEAQKKSMPTENQGEVAYLKAVPDSSDLNITGNADPFGECLSADNSIFSPQQENTKNMPQLDMISKRPHSDSPCPGKIFKKARQNQSWHALDMTQEPPSCAPELTDEASLDQQQSAEPTDKKDFRSNEISGHDDDDGMEMTGAIQKADLYLLEDPLARNVSKFKEQYIIAEVLQKLPEDCDNPHGSVLLETSYSEIEQIGDMLVSYQINEDRNGKELEKSPRIPPQNECEPSENEIKEPLASEEAVTEKPLTPTEKSSLPHETINNASGIEHASVAAESINPVLSCPDQPENQSNELPLEEKDIITTTTENNQISDISEVTDDKQKNDVTDKMELENEVTSSENLYIPFVPETNQYDECLGPVIAERQPDPAPNITMDTKDVSGLPMTTPLTGLAALATRPSLREKLMTAPPDSTVTSLCMEISSTQNTLGLVKTMSEERHMHAVCESTRIIEPVGPSDLTYPVANGTATSPQATYTLPDKLTEATYLLTGKLDDEPSFKRTHSDSPCPGKILKKPRASQSPRVNILRSELDDTIPSNNSNTTPENRRISASNDILPNSNREERLPNWENTYTKQTRMEDWCTNARNQLPSESEACMQHQPGPHSDSQVFTPDDKEASLKGDDSLFSGALDTSVTFHDVSLSSTTTESEKMRNQESFGGIPAITPLQQRTFRAEASAMVCLDELSLMVPRMDGFDDEPEMSSASFAPPCMQRGSHDVEDSFLLDDAALVPIRTSTQMTSANTKFADEFIEVSTMHDHEQQFQRVLKTLKDHATEENCVWSLKQWRDSTKGEGLLQFEIPLLDVAVILDTSFDGQNQIKQLSTATSKSENYRWPEDDQVNDLGVQAMSQYILNEKTKLLKLDQLPHYMDFFNGFAKKVTAMMEDALVVIDGCPSSQLSGQTLAVRLHSFPALFICWMELDLIDMLLSGRPMISFRHKMGRMDETPIRHLLSSVQQPVLQNLTRAAIDLIVRKEREEYGAETRRPPLLF